MDGRVEIGFCSAVLDAGTFAHFQDVDFAAGGPVFTVVAHHPKGRPQSVARFGKLNAGFDAAILKVEFALTVDATGIDLVALAFGRKDKNRFAVVDAHAYISRPVGL